MERKSCLIWLSVIIISTGLPLIRGNSQDQAQRVRLSGTIIDSATALPIPQVNIWASNSSTVSDADGNFSLEVLRGDSIHFSHISYEDLTIKKHISVGQSQVAIKMRERIRLLREVNVYWFLSENMFRQKIMETTLVPSREEEIAMINSKIISYLARYAPVCSMNAYDNHIDYMRGPQPVVIFSSKPTKGLIRAIKNVIRPNLPSYKKFFHTDSLVRSLRYK
jgi:hypothetical protein